MSGAAFRHDHRVRLEEVDAAGIVFFPRYFVWCHEVMARMLDPVPGGYAGLLLRHGMGLPTVHAEADYAAPLRFDDVAAISATVEAIGKSSCTIAFRIERAADSTHVATIRHVVAFAGFREMRAHPLTPELRELFERYRQPVSPG